MTVVAEESKFDKLKNKIKRKEGYSEAGAEGAAAAIGRAKYGKKGMAKKAAAGRNESVVTESKNWDKMAPEARDLVLYAETHPELKKDFVKILDHLAVDKKRGQYDREHALGCYGKHADKSAKLCNQVHGDEDGNLPWHKQFKDHHRNQAASHWEEVNKEHLDRRHEMMHESEVAAQELLDDDKREIYSMMQAALEERPSDFQEHFANAVQPRMVDQLDALKDELRKFVFNHFSGNQMESVNSKSKALLSSKAARAAKPAWQGGDRPTDSVKLDTGEPDDFGFDDAPYGTTHDCP